MFSHHVVDQCSNQYYSEWAFLIPAWSLFAVLFTYAAFISLNFYRNPPLDDLRNVVGEWLDFYFRFI
jgi:hypothetical protein